jgi:hypothetical protein
MALLLWNRKQDVFQGELPIYELQLKYQEFKEKQIGCK